MRAFKVKGAARFARRENISDASLTEAIARAECGRVDADLGGGLIKQRVARPGQGRSGGYRMMIAYRTNDRAFFLFGFAKNERQNISPGELAALRALVTIWLSAPDRQIAAAIKDGLLQEIPDAHDEETRSLDAGESRNGG